MTRTTLSRCLTYHGQEGGIFSHFEREHNIKPTREHLTENTTIIARSPDNQKLSIKEALYILKHNPSINKQYDNFTNVLKLYVSRNIAQKSPALTTIKQSFPYDSPIPDMHKVLLRFGINPSQCREVPLEEYVFDEFPVTDLHSNSPPLAQRLRTRNRKINYKESHQLERRN